MVPHFKNCRHSKFWKTTRADSTWLFLKFILATFRSKTGNVNTPGWPGWPGCEMRSVICGGGAIWPPNIKFSTIFGHFLKNCVFLRKQTDFNQSLDKKLFYDLFLTQNFSKPKFGPRTAFLPYLFWGLEKFLTKKLCQGWFLCKNGLKYSCFWIIAIFFEKWPKITQNRVGGPYWPPHTRDCKKSPHQVGLSVTWLISGP